MDKPRDITPEERQFLSMLRTRPGSFLGKIELSRFENFFHGYNQALRITKQTDTNGIIPKGFQEYVELKYLGHEHSPMLWSSIILESEPDEKKALGIFFELLDEYLVSIGYEPIPVYEVK